MHFESQFKRSLERKFVSFYLRINDRLVKSILTIPRALQEEFDMKIEN